VRRLSLACLAAFLLVPAATAGAAPVLVLEGDRVRVEQDPFLPDTPVAIEARAAQQPGALPAPPPPGPTATPPPGATDPRGVRGVLAGLLASGRIGQGTHDEKLAIWESALATRNRLTGSRRAGLTNAIGVVGWLARSGQLDPSRLNLAFLQLALNTRWWAYGSRIPGAGERVRVSGSRLVFQRIPGQGLAFHPLANWGRVASLFRAGYVAQGREMLDELLAVGSRRGGALTWEYLFWFGGGSPPWTSGLSQGTALVALSAAFRRTQDPRYADAIRGALRLYELAAPTGVRIRTRFGNQYAEYSFAPRYRVINGFVQALNGLWDAWHVLGDGRAAALFRAGDAEARRALPLFDTGRWSRYDNRGRLSGVHYHLLLRDFLSGLCQRSRIAAYCSKASRFSYYLRRFGGPPRGKPLV
jgi:hypothetical protein